MRVEERKERSQQRLHQGRAGEERVCARGGAGREMDDLTPGNQPALASEMEVVGPAVGRGSPSDCALPCRLPPPYTSRLMLPLCPS